MVFLASLILFPSFLGEHREYPKPLTGSPVPGAKERNDGMMRRFGELSEKVGWLEGLVDEQRRDLEAQNSLRFGGMYDDGERVVVTQSMADQEEEQVRQLEDKIKAMQEKVTPHLTTLARC